MQRHRLPDAHRCELRLLEVGVDPDLVERHDRHQRRARTYALAKLHGAVARTEVIRLLAKEPPQVP